MVKSKHVVDRQIGEFDIEVALYKTTDFKELLLKPVNVQIPDLLFVQVKTMNTPDNIVALLKQCWATPTYVNLTMWQNIHFRVHSHQM